MKHDASNGTEQAPEANTLPGVELDWYPEVGDRICVRSSFRLAQYQGAVGKIVKEQPAKLFHIRFDDNNLQDKKLRQQSFYKA